MKILKYEPSSIKGYIRVKFDSSCDVCNEGLHRRTGKVFYVYPLLYEHKCNNCGDTVILHESYPFYETKEDHKGELNEN